MKENIFTTTTVRVCFIVHDYAGPSRVDRRCVCVGTCESPTLNVSAKSAKIQRHFNIFG